MNFWSELPRLSFRNEGDVETRLVLPLLDALDYPRDYIASKYPVKFHEGTKGRPHEADYVIFCSDHHDRDTSLAVFEAKSPKAKLEKAGPQAESYASWLRAPFYILTNGLQLQIWQMQLSRQSSLVFDTDVADLAGRRGDLEALLHKEALIAHCDALGIKELRIENMDPMPFLDATLAVAAGDFIDTRTFRRPDDDKLGIGAESFWESLPPAVMVTGGPGSGKTTFARVLERHMARQAIMGLAELLPVYVYLPDVSVSDGTVEEYSRARVSAHLPELCTRDAFRTRLLRPGKAAFLCDGLDRVPQAARPAIDAHLRHLRRDFPQCRLVVFGQRPATDALGLHAELELLPLSHTEMVEAYAAIMHCTEDEARAVLSTMPHVSRELFAVPLFWAEAIQHHQLHGRWPRDLATALESWLRRLLSAGNATSSLVAERERALTLIAPIRGLTTKSALATLKSEGLDESMLDGLVECGALRERASSLDCCHELLRAYLEVRWALERPDERVSMVLERGGTAETTLLSLLIRGREDEDIVWKRILAQGFVCYAEAVAARKRQVEASGLAMTDLEVRPLLTGIWDGMFKPLVEYLPDLEEVILDELGVWTGDANRIPVGIRGDVDLETGWLHYCYADDREVKHEAAGTVGLDTPGRIIGVSMGSYEVGIGSGRLLGMRDLRDALLRVTSAGRLLGGPIWCRERLMGKADQLRSMGAEISPSWDLHRFCEWLTKNEDKAFSQAYRGDDMIVIRDLLPLTEPALEAGNVGLAYGGLPGPDLDPPAGATSWSIWEQYSPDAMCALAKELKLREIRAYKEVVEASFQNIAREMMYAQMPARYELHLNASQDRPWVAERWFPERTWDDVDIDVRVGTAVPELGLRDEFERLERELTALSRPTHSISGGCSYGISVSGTTRGLTPVMERVISAIDNDLRNVFRAID